MEFEKDIPASDMDRRLAETKKLTLEPLHSDIAPENEPDSEVVARHLTEGALANAPNDTEQSSAPVKPSAGLLDRQAAPSSANRGKTILLVGTVIIAGAILTTVGLFLRI